MSHPKVTILGFHKNSHWSSLRIIKERWEKTYQALANAGTYYFDDSSKQLPESDIYILLDHQLPSVEDFLKLNSKAKPICWHIHGDLTIRLREFQTLLDLVTVPIEFIVASHSQKKLLASLYPGLSENIQVIGYPVPDDFKSKVETTNHWRQKLSISPNATVIGYAGRWSDQKGVIDLLQSVRVLEDENLHLLLAGHFDDLGFAQLTGQWIDKSAREMIPKLLAPNVHVIPTIAPNEMPSFLAALDSFVCSGCFHDEDFNLTAAEALSVGTPCILSAWGGHLDHAQNCPQGVTLLEPELGPTGMKVPLNNLIEAIQRIQKKRITFHQKTSLPSIRNKKIQSCQASEMAIRLASRVDFLNKNGKLDIELYQELYQSYLKE